MYKAIVVEDSRPILRNIVAKIEHVDHRVRVVATASNGTEALDYLHKDTFDIIFSDIKMPVMDGLDLLAEAKRLAPSMRCVIISGYDDFEFARRAIELKTEDYILKPVVESDLRAVLDRIVESLESDKVDKFRAALRTTVKRCEKTFRSPNDLPRTPYGLCLVRSGPLRNGQIAPNSHQVFAHFRREFPDESVVIVTETRYYSELSVLVDHNYASAQSWEEACRRIYESILKTGQLPRISCSSGQGDVTSLPQYISNLSENLDDRVFLDEPTFIVTDAAELRPSSKLSRDEIAQMDQEARLVTSTRSITDFRRHIERIIQSWRDVHQRLVLVRRQLRAIVDALNELDPDSTTTGKHTIETDDILGICTSYNDITEELCRVFRDIVARKERANLSSDEIVEAAVKFFRANLYRTISMRDVAARLGVSSSYVHRILRSALGTPPMEYYNNLKIDEAKQLMERYPELRVKDIAESLGFQDQHYFSRVFKNRVSLSPVQYRGRTREAK